MVSRYTTPDMSYVMSWFGGSAYPYIHDGHIVNDDVDQWMYYLASSSALLVHVVVHGV